MVCGGVEVSEKRLKKQCENNYENYTKNIFNIHTFSAFLPAACCFLNAISSAVGFPFLTFLFFSGLSLPPFPLSGIVYDWIEK